MGSPVGLVSGSSEPLLSRVYRKFLLLAINDQDVSIAPFRVSHFRVENFGFRAVILQWFSREHSPEPLWILALAI